MNLHRQRKYGHLRTAIGQHSIRAGLAVVATAVMLVGTGSVASADYDASSSKYTYKFVEVAAPTYYRCAAGKANFRTVGGVYRWGATTYSQYGAFCAGAYTVGPGNISAGHILVKWVSGTPTACHSDTQDSIYSETEVSTSYDLDLELPSCGTATYSVTSFHNVAIGPYVYGAMLASGTINL